MESSLLPSRKFQLQVEHQGIVVSPLIANGETSYVHIGDIQHSLTKHLIILWVGIY